MIDFFSEGVWVGWLMGGFCGSLKSVDSGCDEEEGVGLELTFGFFLFFSFWVIWTDFLFVVFLGA